METKMERTPEEVTLSLQHSARSAFAFAFENTGLNAQKTKPEEVSLQRFVRSAFQISPRGSNLSKESVEVGCS